MYARACVCMRVCVGVYPRPQSCGFSLFKLSGPTSTPLSIASITAARHARSALGRLAEKALGTWNTIGWAVSRAEYSASRVPARSNAWQACDYIRVHGPRTE